MVVIFHFLCHIQLSGKWSNRILRKVKQKGLFEKDTKGGERERKKRNVTNPPKQERDQKNKERKRMLNQSSKAGKGSEEKERKKKNVKPILPIRKGIKRERKKKNVDQSSKAGK